MSYFRAGDRVIDEDGKAGEVIEVGRCDGDQYLAVRFDEPIWPNGSREGGVHAEGLKHEEQPMPELPDELAVGVKFSEAAAGEWVNDGWGWRRAGKSQSIDNKGQPMHYRNGREAKNGDKVIQLGASGPAAAEILNVGILYAAAPGNDFCNGGIAPTSPSVASACLCDCLHVDDLAALLKEHGLDKRPG